MLHHLPKKCLKNHSPWIWGSWPLLFKTWHGWQLLYSRSQGLSKSFLFLRPGHLHLPVTLNSIQGVVWKRRQSGRPYKTRLSPWHKQYCATRQSGTKRNLSLCFPKGDIAGLCCAPESPPCRSTGRRVFTDSPVQHPWQEKRKKHTTGTSLWRGDKCPH